MSRYRIITFGKNLLTSYKKPIIAVGCVGSCYFIGKRVMSSPTKKGPNQEPSRLSRKTVVEKEKDIREHYINLPLEEKRKLYKCGNKYVLPSTIEDWAAYSETVVNKYEFKPKYNIDEELNKKVCMWRGDITKLEIDAIVNAANNSLLGGGGVDGAIHSAAGPKLVAECSKLGGCDTGDAKITAGYNLPAKYVIHTVGPIGEKPDKLRDAYLNSLNRALENGAQTIAFPCISTGIYGYHIEKATPVVLRTVREWLSDVENKNKIKKIIFCVFLEGDLKVYEHRLLEYFPVTAEEPPTREKEVSKSFKTPKKEKETTKNDKHNRKADKENNSEKANHKENEGKRNVEINKDNSSAIKATQDVSNIKGQTGSEVKSAINDSDHKTDEGNTEAHAKTAKNGTNENGTNDQDFENKNSIESPDKESERNIGKETTGKDSKYVKSPNGKKTKKGKPDIEEELLAPVAKKKPSVSDGKLKTPHVVL